MIDLSSLSVANSDEEAIAMQREIFETVRVVARSTEANRLFIAVTDRDAEATHGAWKGGIAGLLRTLSLEVPEVASRFVSIARSSRDAAALAEAIAAEVLTGGVDADIDLDESLVRTAPGFAEARAAKREDLSPVPADTVLIVSGGARGVTASCLEELAKHGRCRFAILGRTDADYAPSWAAGRVMEGDLQQAFIAFEKDAGRMPSPADVRQAVASVAAAIETRHSLEALRARGSEVLYLPCDIKDGGDVAMAVSTVRAHYGRIDGIVHAAGVLADNKIA